MIREALLLIVFIVGLAVAGHIDSKDAEITAQIEKETYEKVMDMPIHWTATVTQCDTERGCRTRFYSPSRLK